jgi:putative addiction module component (TIGR02574 family)
MSIDEIRKLDTKERIILMNNIWESLQNEDTVYQSPSWHKEILDDRITKINNNEAKFISLEELKN